MCRHSSVKGALSGPPALPASSIRFPNDPLDERTSHRHLPSQRACLRQQRYRRNPFQVRFPPPLPLFLCPNRRRYPESVKRSARGVLVSCSKVRVPLRVHTTMPTSAIRRHQPSQWFSSRYVSSSLSGVAVPTSLPAAIKFEPRKSDAPQLRDEYRAYRTLTGTRTCAYRHPSPLSNPVLAGIPQVHYFGQEGLHNVLVLDLFGPNLEDLFDMCGRKFSVKTVCMLARQMVCVWPMSAVLGFSDMTSNIAHPCPSRPRQIPHLQGYQARQLSHRRSGDQKCQHHLRHWYVRLGSLTAKK